MLSDAWGHTVGVDISPVRDLYLSDYMSEELLQVVWFEV